MAKFFIKIPTIKEGFTFYECDCNPATFEKKLKAFQDAKDPDAKEIRDFHTYMMRYMREVGMEDHSITEDFGELQYVEDFGELQYVTEQESEEAWGIA